MNPDNAQLLQEYIENGEAELAYEAFCKGVGLAIADDFKALRPHEKFGWATCYLACLEDVHNAQDLPEND